MMWRKSYGEGALWKKTIRDMKQSKSQFVSILIMATLAVSIVTGLDSIWFTIQNHADAMYRSTSLSDLWVTVANPVGAAAVGNQADRRGHAGGAALLR